MTKPTNYGFIPQTLDEDGDELDVLLITDEPLPTGIFLEAKYIGVMKFVDDDEIDDFADSYGEVRRQPVLISYNKKYRPRVISASSEFTIVGRVLH